jgi:hypothetical protein
MVEEYCFSTRPITLLSICGSKLPEHEAFQNSDTSTQRPGTRELPHFAPSVSAEDKSARVISDGRGNAPDNACLPLCFSHHTDPVGRGSTGRGPIGRGSTGRGPTGRSVMGRGVSGSVPIMSPASGSATVTVTKSDNRAKSFMMNCYCYRSLS